MNDSLPKDYVSTMTLSSPLIWKEAQGDIMSLADFKLEDRFARSEGDVAMSGVQALLRVLVDQLRADRRDGLNNAAMVSGYRGSPLGGIDSLMLGNAQELVDNNIEFVPGLDPSAPSSSSRAARPRLLPPPRAIYGCHVAVLPASSS